MAIFLPATNGSWWFSGDFLAVLIPFLVAKVNVFLRIKFPDTLRIPFWLARDQIILIPIFL